MKRKLAAALLAGVLSAGMICTTGTVMAAGTAKTEETNAKEEDKAELKTIGEETEGAVQVKIKNLTGKVITGVAVKNAQDAEYSDNLLTEGDKIEAEEERIFWFNPKDYVKDDAEEKEDEVKTYNVQLTFEDETTAQLHTFPFGDPEEAEIHLEDTVAYLIFESKNTKNTENTLKREKSYVAKPETSSSSASYDTSYEDVYYDESYDDSGYEDYSYDDSSDDTASYEDTGSADTGSGDEAENPGCLDNGLLN